MISPHMSNPNRTSLERVQDTARGIVSAVVLAIGVGACHHSSPPSMIMTPVAGNEAHTEATRAQLQELAITTEQGAAKAPDAEERQQKQMQAATIRARLRDGDFDVGDRVLLSIRGDTVTGDTVTVRAGRMIRLPNMPDISLQGVLRSELQDYLTTQLARYIKHPEVQTTSLVRVAVLGSVGKPGYYQLPADLALADAIMTAGGPTGTADVDKTKIERGTDVIYSSKLLGQEVAKGATLDQLNIRPGDQILVGERHKTNWPIVASIVGITAGLISTFVILTRH
jgi:protein involved in polysaccharide export with SLBB domain